MSGAPSEQLEPARRQTGKSPAAFKTISEVADDLDVPQHVLRFWETKFPQVKPLKRGGGRRYYRPEDVALLHRIRACLYQEGYTIKGVQKLLRESPGRAPVQPQPALPSLERVPDPPSPADAAGRSVRGALATLRADLVEWRRLLAAARR